MHAQHLFSVESKYMCPIAAPEQSLSSKNIHSLHKYSLGPTVCQALFWALVLYAELNQVKPPALHINQIDTEIKVKLQLVKCRNVEINVALRTYNS